MTNYITSVGVQQFSITIASGNTTGTATISAVGSGAFILYGGTNPSVTANSSEDLAYLTLTNSTTITATRKTGTTGTVIMTGIIVDGDTTSLIKSVQYGTVSILSGLTSGTTAISAVTNANTALAFLGTDDTRTAFSAIDNSVRIALSGTTVTATKGGSGGSDTTIVGFCVIEFQGSALTANAVQNVSATTSSTSVTSWTASITSVTTANAICIFGGYTTTGNTGLDSSTLMSGVLTSSTVFTANLNTSGTGTKVFNASVVEFNSGVLFSSVQRGTTTLTGVTSNTSSITSVTAANSGISFLGNTSSDAGINLNEDYGAVALTNGTTVTTTKVTATANITSSWEVFEFPAFSSTATTYSISGASSGTVSVASGTITATPTSGTWPSSVSIALTDASTGSFATSPLTPTGGTSTPVTFTYTPGAIGAISISFNSSGAMTDPSAWVYTSNASGHIFMEWLPLYG